MFPHTRWVVILYEWLSPSILCTWVSCYSQVLLRLIIYFPFALLNYSIIRNQNIHKSITDFLVVPVSCLQQLMHPLTSGSRIVRTFGPSNRSWILYSSIQDLFHLYVHWFSLLSLTAVIPARFLSSRSTSVHLISAPTWMVARKSWRKKLSTRPS